MRRLATVSCTPFVMVLALGCAEQTTAPSEEGDAIALSATGKPQPLKIETELCFPIINATSLPPPTSESLQGQFLSGEGVWLAETPFQDEGTVSAEEEHFFGPFTPTGLVGIVSEKAILSSDLGSIEIDYLVQLLVEATFAGNFHVVGGTGAYQNIHGTGKVTGTFRFVSSDDPECANVATPFNFAVFVEETYDGQANFTP